MGRLLEQGLHAAMPSTHFPFAVRLNVDLLAADGSEAVPALSAATLALADAGVPVESHVAGGVLSCLPLPSYRFTFFPQHSIAAYICFTCCA